MSTDRGRAALAAHKKKLIAEGELYRIGVLHAKTHVSHALRPEALLHGILEHAVGFASNRVETLLAPNGLRLQTVMPYLLAVFSYLGRKKLIKPALGTGVAAIVALVSFMRRKRQ